MKEIKLESINMESIYECIERGKAMVKGTDDIAIYNFNDVELKIDKNTNVKLLVRDYNNAHYLELKSIGPNHKKNYSKEDKKLISKNILIDELKFSFMQINVHIKEIDLIIKRLNKI